jgi:integrase
MKLTVKLTDKLARTLQLPAGKDEEVFWDADLAGFGVRVRRHNDARSWLVQYDFGGRTEKVWPGSIEERTAASARGAAKDVLAAVRLGRNPAAEKRAARDEAGETFGALLPRYLPHEKARLKPRSYQEKERHLLIHCAPLHRRPINAIDQRSAAILLGKLADKSGPRAANNTRASGSGFFSWLMREGIAATNPFANTNKAPQGDPRERTPSDSELAEIWVVLPDGDYGDIVKLLALTGARREEIAGLCWSEINLGEALIVLPAARTKGRRQHEIPLSAPALAILKARPRDEGRDFVFGRGDGGFSGWSRAKRHLDVRIDAARRAAAKKGEPAPMPAWNLHDLRRAFSTTLHERLGVAPHIVEDCLGHSTFRQGVASVYNKSSYRNEKRRALDLWAAHLMAAVVEGRASKIVPLRTA